MLKLIECCLNDISGWFNDTKLVYNQDKKQFINFTAKSRPSPTMIIDIGFTFIHPIITIRNSGVILNRNFIMISHVSKVFCSAALFLNKIGHLIDYLGKKSTLKLVHSFISSRLDFCNSLFLGLSDRELNKLQRIKNSATRLVPSTSKREHSRKRTTLIAYQL